jgi:hypothetical protein
MLRRRPLLAALPLVSVWSRGGQAAADLPPAAEIAAIAEEAFVYGLPLVMNYR